MIDTLGGGGAERVLTYILRKLDRSAFEVELFLMIQGGVYAQQIPSDIPCTAIFRDSDTIQSKPLRMLYRFYRRSMLELFKLFPVLLSSLSGINKKYDIGISFCEGHNTPLLRLKGDHFGKTIAWIHVDLRTHRCVLNLEQLYLAVGAADKLFFVSEDARRGFEAIYPEFDAKGRTEVVYNPIDIEAILAAATGKKTSEETEPMLLSIGRLTRQKRFDKLLNVHRRLLDKGIKHTLCILGEGELRGALEAQIKQLGIEETCSLPGFLDPYPQLEAADVFVSTSDYEGLPVVVCEAMVLAKPIVCTNITGPRELLEGGKYGLLVDNNEQAIERGLEQLINSPALREQYSKRLEESRNRFIFSSEVKQIEERMLAV